MRAAIYTRVSKKEAALEGYSLEGQRTTLEAWAAREGWEVVARYEDAGISAKDMEAVRRPSFELALAEAGRVYDLLLVLKQDRFARSIADAYQVKRTLQRAGARVMYHDEPAANEQTQSGLLMEAIGFAGAEGYLMDLSRKIARGYATMAELGIHVGDVPFGYTRRQEKRAVLEVDEHEAAGVRWAFETYATGADSMAAIADELARRGFRPHSRAKRDRGQRTEWAISTVATMLKNRVYLGEVYYRGDYYPGQHAPIITPDLFNRARLAADRRKRSPRTYARAGKNVYMITGIAECATCRSNLWGDTSGSGALFYRCSSRHSRRDCADRRRGVRVAPVEGRVERAILATAAQLEGLGDLIAEQSAQMRPMDEEQQRERLQGIIRRATKVMLAGGDEVEALRAIRTAREDIARLDAQPRSEGAVDALLDFAELWPHFTAAERREAAQIVFERVRVSIPTAGVLVLPRPEYAAAYNAAAQAGGGAVSYADERVVLVRPAGFEPATSASAGQRSIP